MFNSKPADAFRNQVEGTWGEFETPAGRVAYVLTKARLGHTANDNEQRLTSHLRPVREVLEVAQLSFSQLLQRDLDDHRVATGLLPYVLAPQPTGLAFFPPIVAILLPFSHTTPRDRFEGTATESVDSQDDLTFQQVTCHPSFQAQRLLDADGKFHQIRLGRLKWNDEHGRLVVIDGQHRAMALLAIQRTILGTWNSDGAGRYRHFYEERVNQLLAEAKARGREVQLERVEMPVAVCWLPEFIDGKGNPHTAARKLFVDVNKEARAPSKSRLILLSDSELLSILTRGFLNDLRRVDHRLPLFAIEYDNPKEDEARPVKWSVITNLKLLYRAIELSVFGPKKYLESVGVPFGGRKSEREMDPFMRAQLCLSTVFPETIDDGERVVRREEVGNRLFPASGVDSIVQRFNESWGGALQEILAGLLHYSAHARAIRSLYQNWITDDAVASLARDALFEGVGMFWTLRDADAYWRDRRNEQLIPAGAPKPEVVKAWELIAPGGPRHLEFKELRARELLGGSGSKAVRDSEDAFDVMNTHACQLGAVLALGSLCVRGNVACEGVRAFASQLVDAWNRVLSTDGPGGDDRRRMFSKDARDPINRMRKLDTPLAVYFRYLWFEVLAASETSDPVFGTVSKDVVSALVLEARAAYLFGYLVPEAEKGIKRANPNLARPSKRESVRAKAIAQESKGLQKALQRWVGLDEAVYDQWFAGASKSAVAVAESEAVAADVVDGEEPEPEGESLIS